MKNMYPVKLAEDEVGNKLEEKSAFAWWVPYTLSKNKSMMSKVKYNYWQWTHKYAIILQKTVEEYL